MLVELEPCSTLARTITNTLKHNFFEKKSLNWLPTKFEFVCNQKLTQEFERKSAYA
jgi:hypothetical protein